MAFAPFSYQLYKGLPYFTLSAWKDDGIRAGFSAKLPGSNAFNYAYALLDSTEVVLANRHKLLEAIGLSSDCWISAQQVHGTNIHKTTIADRGRGFYSYEDAIKSTDGLYTTQSGELLVTFFADCVPLYFYVKDQPLIAVVHAGWRGTVAQIASEMVATFIAEGALVTNIRVAIGCSIGPCCYRVGLEVFQELQALLCESDLQKVALALGNQEWLVDLRLVNKLLLLTCGIVEQNILVTKICTHCSEGHFHSYRRDGANAGRMIAWISRVED